LLGKLCGSTREVGNARWRFARFYLESSFFIAALIEDAAPS
jgi:hypothetical protein